MTNTTDSDRCNLCIFDDQPCKACLGVEDIVIPAPEETVEAPKPDAVTKCHCPNFGAHQANTACIDDAAWAGYAEMWDALPEDDEDNSTIVDDFVPTPRTEQSVPAPEKAVEAPKPRQRRERSVPQARTATRQPDSQNEHLWACRKLLSKNALLVALVANMEMGARHGAGFSTSVTKLTGDYLASATGLTRKYVVLAMNEAVQAGLFIRVDKGNGGSKGRNPASYTPVVPN
jgi:hypothetical protein